MELEERADEVIKKVDEAIDASVYSKARGDIVVVNRKKLKTEIVDFIAKLLKDLENEF